MTVKKGLTAAQLARVQAIADELAGQCLLSIDDVLTSEEANDSEFLSELDSRIFTCEVCGWICPDDERTEDSEICEDCAND